MFRIQTLLRFFLNQILKKIILKMILNLDNTHFILRKRDNEVLHTRCYFYFKKINWPLDSLIQFQFPVSHEKKRLLVAD